MSETRLTLKLAQDHILGLSEQTEDPVVLDLLKQALTLLDCADTLIMALNGSICETSLRKEPGFQRHTGRTDQYEGQYPSE